MSRNTRVLKIILAGFLILLFQNCKSTNPLVDGGTTVTNPMRTDMASLHFASFNSKVTSVDMCLTNISLRFIPDINFKPTTVTAPQLQIQGFDLSYLYYDSTSNRFYLNGLNSTKSIHLDPSGTLIGNFAIPDAQYDQVIFGFSTCPDSNQASVSVVNGAGQFSDTPYKFFALTFTGQRDLHLTTESTFSIQLFTDSLAGVTSNSALSSVLAPYREFNVIGLASTFIANHTQVRLDTMATQSTGKTILAGFGYGYGESRLIAVRYNSDGSLDTTFGSNNGTPQSYIDGLVSPGVISIATNDIRSNGTGVAAGPDDSIYLFTNLYINAKDEFAVKKLKPDGTIDTSFGRAGWSAFSTSVEDYAKDLIFQPDGNIILVGNNPNHEIIVARMSPTGVLDKSFGSNGITRIPSLPYTYEDKISAGLQSDGKILIASTVNLSDRQDWFVYRLLTNGQVDTSFNVDISFNSYLTFVQKMIVLSDNSILLAGYIPGTNGNDFTIVKLLANGQIDSNFGTNGKVIFDFGGDDKANGILLNSQNQIIVSGQTLQGTTFSFALLALNLNGSIDKYVSSSGTRLFTLNSANLGGLVSPKPSGYLSIGGSADTYFDLLTLIK